MAQKTSAIRTASAPAQQLPQRLAWITLGLSAAFLILLALLHLLKPELDPSWRMISEYEIGRYGWLMRLAFFCWGGSVLALHLALPAQVASGAGRIGRWWLLVIALFLFGAGIFATLPIDDPTVTLVDNLHAICGVVVILTFPIAATLTARGLARGAWRGSRTALTWATLLVWVGVVGYFAVYIIANQMNPNLPRVGPHVPQGWPNRIMVVLYHAWLWVVALPAARNNGGG